MGVGRVNVRDNSAAQGAIGLTEPVVGMTTVDNKTIQARSNDETVTLSANTSIGASGQSVKAEDVFIYASQASGAGLGGSWPSGVRDVSFGQRTKTSKTTTH